MIKLKGLGLLILSTVFLFSACGGGGGDDPPPPDTEAPSILSSIPSDGAKPVSVTTDIVISFSESLAGISVSENNISIKNASGAKKNNVDVILTKAAAPVVTTVTYDDQNKSITLSPLKALEYNHEYVVTLTGIQDPAGNTMADTSIRFTTYINPTFRSSFYYDSSGQLLGYNESRYDAQGNKTLYISYDNVGPDATWLTADDGISSYSKFEYNSENYQTLTASMSDPGVDLAWFTIDDIASSYTSYTRDINGRAVLEVYYSGAGAVGGDGISFTADDIPMVYAQREYNANNQPTLNAWMSDPGPDATWMTADDVSDDYKQRRYDVNGDQVFYAYFFGAGASGTDGISFNEDDIPSNYSTNVYQDGYQVRRANYSGTALVGNDGVAFTNDDVPSSYSSYVYDAENNQIRSVSYNAASIGADGIAFTSDDVPNNYYRREYDANNNQTLSAYYNGAGVDTNWFTSDDEVSHYDHRSFDANSNQIQNAQYIGSGADVTWFTSDDVVNGNFNVKSYDANGNQTQSVTYSDAGLDGQTFTADDVVARYSIHEVNAENQQTLLVIYNDAGLDTTWFTADDEILNYSKKVYDPNGNRTQEMYSDHPGADGDWMTQDDRLANYYYSEYDQYQNLMKTVSLYYDYVNYIVLEPDGISFTLSAPSYELYVYGYTYNENGQRTESQTFPGSFTDAAGNDGIWLTADDIPSNTYDYGFDSTGNRTQTTRSYIGADAIWGTADDITDQLSNEYNSDL